MRLAPALTAGASAAALVLLTACGGGSGGSRASGASTAAASTATSDAAPSSTASSGTPGSGTAGSGSSSAAPSSTSSEEVRAFCADAGAVLTDLSTAFTNASDPTQLPALLDRAATGLQSVQPPAEIADSWAGFSGSIAQLAEASRQVDLSTPDGQARFTQQYETLTSQASGAQQDVDAYVTARCPGLAGSPTS
jgi:hypothetical protein